MAEQMGSAVAVLTLAAVSALFALVGWAIFPEVRQME
jgi:hypothetical protein